MRRGFTLIEIIIVVTVISIVAAMGLGYIADLLKMQAQEEVRHSYEEEARAIISQIAARLRNSVVESIVAIHPATNACIPLTIFDGVAHKDYLVLAWHGMSEEGFLGSWDATLGYHRPGWSGLVDLNRSQRNGTNATIISPSSKFSDADVIISSLYSGSDLNHSAIYFVENSLLKSCEEFGWEANTTTEKKIHPIDQYNSNTNLSIRDLASTVPIKEYYKIISSGYAIYNEDGNLTLYYHFRPWLGEQYTSGKKVLLGENVDKFGFIFEDGVVRINVCVGRNDQAGLWSGLWSDENLTVCKEEAIVP